jgi:hypothetical protein
MQIIAQCPVKKVGQYYGFFRVTNFKEKVCWLSEPFAYDIVSGKIAHYDEMKECFKRKVTALGGNVEHDVNDFGAEQVTWLNNTYDPKAELESSYNWGLPSAIACVKYISGEIKYKMGVRIDVKIVRMFSTGIIDNSEYHQ